MRSQILQEPSPVTGAGGHEHTHKHRRTTRSVLLCRCIRTSGGSSDEQRSQNSSKFGGKSQGQTQREGNLSQSRGARRHVARGLGLTAVDSTQTDPLGTPRVYATLLISRANMPINIINEDASSMPETVMRVASTRVMPILKQLYPSQPNR